MALPHHKLHKGTGDERPGEQLVVGQLLRQLQRHSATKDCSSIVPLHEAGLHQPEHAQDLEDGILSRLLQGLSEELCCRRDAVLGVADPAQAMQNIGSNQSRRKHRHQPLEEAAGAPGISGLEVAFGRGDQSPASIRFLLLGAEPPGLLSELGRSLGGTPGPGPPGSVLQRPCDLSVGPFAGQCQMVGPLFWIRDELAQVAVQPPALLGVGILIDHRGEQGMAEAHPSLLDLHHASIHSLGERSLHVLPASHR